jgi:hypothetical protein
MNDGSSRSTGAWKNKDNSICSRYKFLRKESVLWPIITVVALVVFVIILGWIEEKDMTEVNKAYYNMDMSDPSQVMEYLNLIAGKPLWRVTLMMSVLFGFISTAIYCWSSCVSWYLYLVLSGLVAYVIMGGYMSYYVFHIVTPNGGQETINKLQHWNRPTISRWG